MGKLLIGGDLVVSVVLDEQFQAFTHLVTLLGAQLVCVLFQQLE